MATTAKVPSGDDLTRVITTIEALNSRMDSLEGGGKKADTGEDDKDKKADAKDETEEEKEAREKGEREEKERNDAEAAAKKADEEKKAEEAKKAADAAGRKDGELDKKILDVDGLSTLEKISREERVELDKRRDAAIADSIAQNKKLQDQLSAQNAEIARLTALMKPRSDDEHAAFADAQARADTVFAGFGKQAPRPLEGETLLNYRKRLATHLKPHSAVWKTVKFSQLPDEAFAIAEGQVYSDAAAAASNPVDLGDGELREVVKTDPRTRLNTIVFYGKDSFVKGMGRPGRRVTGFRTSAS